MRHSRQSPSGGGSNAAAVLPEANLWFDGAEGRCLTSPGKGEFDE